MATTNAQGASPSLHPVLVTLLAFPVPLFFGALLSDWAYSSTYHVQWINFASWLIAGALVFSGFALLWSVIESLRADRPHCGSKWLLVGLAAATFVLGFVNAVVHAKDGWAAMPGGLILSIIVTILAVATLWVAFSSSRRGEVA
jgi:uncharacterized membrane protein